MSTEPHRRKAALRLAFALLASTALVGCATPETGRPVRAFSEIGPGRPSPADAPPPSEPGPDSPHIPATAHIIGPPMRLRPALPAPAEPQPVLPVTLSTAADRIATWLEAAGFAIERRPEGGGERLAATRMGPPAALLPDAVCGLEAMHRPDISSSDVEVTLTPAPGGVQVETTTRFVEIDTRLISGDLSR